MPLQIAKNNNTVECGCTHLLGRLLNQQTAAHSRQHLIDRHHAASFCNNPRQTSLDLSPIKSHSWNNLQFKTLLHTCTQWKTCFRNHRRSEGTHRVWVSRRATCRTCCIVNHDSSATNLSTATPSCHARREAVINLLPMARSEPQTPSSVLSGSVRAHLRV